jgi:type I restriction enzyme S subunit
VTAWPRVPIREFCDARLGKMLDRKRETGTRSKPYLRNVNVRWGHFELSEVFEMDFSEAEQQEFRLVAGDVLVCEGGEVGRAAVWQDQIEECYFQKALHRLRPDRNKCLPEFLRLTLEFLSVTGGFDEYTSHSTIAHLTGVKLGAIGIPLPPLEEQRRIVDLLERLASIRELRRDARQTAQQIVHALFVKMFGDPATNPMKWQAAPFGTLIEACDYGTSEKGSEDSNGVPVIRMGNLSADGFLNLNALKYLPGSVSDNSRYVLREGDLLFNRTNSKELVGKMGLWDAPFDAVAASYFIRIRTNIKRVLPTFIWVFFNTPFMKRRLLETARGAIGQANINSKELKAFEIPVPPLDLQHLFATRMANLMRIRERHSAAGMIDEQTVATVQSLLFR